MTRPHYVTPPPEEVFPLFAAPAQRHSATSVAAAESFAAATLNRLERLVLDFIRSRPDGVTDEEIATGLKMNPSTARPRRITLARRGLVVEAGTRKAASGRGATVWMVA